MPSWDDIASKPGYNWNPAQASTTSGDRGEWGYLGEWDTQGEAGQMSHWGQAPTGINPNIPKAPTLNPAITAPAPTPAPTPDPQIEWAANKQVANIDRTSRFAHEQYQGAMATIEGSARSAGTPGAGAQDYELPDAAFGERLY